MRELWISRRGAKALIQKELCTDDPKGSPFYQARSLYGELKAKTKTAAVASGGM